MAQRSMTLRELNARGIYLSERGEGTGADQTVSSRMMAEMKKNGLSVEEAFRKVLSEDRDLTERYARSHGKPLTLCEEPSSARALGAFIVCDRFRATRDARGRFFGIEGKV